MANLPYLSKAQSKFLRAFKDKSFGPEASDWPSVVILRRWLRRPGFVVAMQSIKKAMRYQADFQLLAAASVAAQVLHTCVASADHSETAKEISAMSDLLKLAHLRERFTSDADQMVQPSEESLTTALARLHPDLTVGEALQSLKILESRSTSRLTG